MHSATEYDVIIAGAGIVGASVAWHLASSGLRIAVIDATGPAAGASGASDGSVSVASKKPGPAAWLAVASLEHTAELARPGMPLHGHFHLRPSYFFATCPEEEQALDDLGSKLNGLGGSVRISADGSGPVVLSGATAFASRILAVEGEGHMLGYSAVSAYFRAAGVRVHRHWPAQVRAVNADTSGVRAIVNFAEGATQVLRAGVLVCALGLNSTELFPDLPLRPRAGQLIVTDVGGGERLPGLLTAASYLMQKTQSSTYSPRPPSVIDPLATGQYLIGSSREDHADPMRTDFATVHRLLQGAAEVWPEVRRRRVLRVFAGVRAASADGLPIVGRLPEAPNVIVATGFEGDGICLSALIGREVARMVTGDEISDGLTADLRALSPERFFPLPSFASTAI